MAENGNVRYLRYILLLGEGVLLVLRGIVRREVVRIGSTLEAVLTVPSNRRILETRCSSQTQCLHLYPSGSTVNSDIDTWDISLLTVLLEGLFWSNLSSAERLRICYLRDNRNQFQGHPPALSMDETDYATRSADLITVLQDLASGLDQHTRDELTRIINNSSSVNFNYHAAINSLQQLYEFKEEMLQELRREFEAVNLRLDTIQGENRDHGQMTIDISTVQGHMHGDLLDTKSLAEENKRILQTLSEVASKSAESNQEKLANIEKMLTELMSQGKQQTHFQQDVDANINIESERQENATEAQNIIVSTINDILKQIRPDVMEDSETSEAILQKVNEFLTRYEGRELTVALLELIKDILQFGNILEARNGSVKLKIRFTFYRGCLHFIQYLKSKKCQKCFKAVSQALTNKTGHVISLSADIAEESLLDLHRHLEAECEKLRLTRTMLLPVQCKGIMKLNNIWKFLQKGGSDKHMKRLSEILTKMVGGKVTVTTSVNLVQFEQALLKLEMMDAKRKEKVLEPYKELEGRFGKENDDNCLTFTLKEMYPVEDKTDRRFPRITKIELLPDDRLLLLDSSNRKLKLIDSSFKLVSSCHLPDCPISVCYIGSGKAAVSLGSIGILIVNVSEGLVTEKYHELDHRCFGLAFHSDILYITAGENKVYTYTKNVTQKRVFNAPSVQYIFDMPVAISADGDMIYMIHGRRLITMDNKGNFASALRNSELNNHTDIAVAGDGTVFVLDLSGHIMQLDHTGQKVLNTALLLPNVHRNCFCFDIKSSRLIVGGFDEKIYIFKLQK